MGKQGQFILMKCPTRSNQEATVSYFNSLGDGLPNLSNAYQLYYQFMTMPTQNYENEDQENR